MTLISLVYGNGYPVIVSDRAISDPTKTRKIILPSTGRETGENTAVAEFCVKSIIIKDILCVAFSGLVYEIEIMRSQILDYFMHREPNQQSLAAFYEQMDHSHDVSVLFALGGPEFEDNKIFVARYGNTWKEDHSREKLDIIASGSGASDWIAHFLDFQNYLSPSGDKAEDCRQRALMASVRFISEEMGSSIHLLNGWGGGFDIIFYQNGRFQWFNNLVYSFLYTKEEKLDSIIQLSINHNSYLNGNAIVFNINEERNHSFFVVAPFRDSNPVDPAALVPKLWSSNVVSCIFIKRLDGNVEKLIVLLKEFDPEATPMFLAGEVDGEFQFVFKPIYRLKIIEAIKQYIN